MLWCRPLGLVGGGFVLHKAAFYYYFHPLFLPRTLSSTFIPGCNETTLQEGTTLCVCLCVRVRVRVCTCAFVQYPVCIHGSVLVLHTCSPLLLSVWTRANKYLLPGPATNKNVIVTLPRPGEPRLGQTTSICQSSEGEPGCFIYMRVPLMPCGFHSFSL